jgi:hypothetical protein
MIERKEEGTKKKKTYPPASKLIAYRSEHKEQGYDPIFQIEFCRALTASMCYGHSESRHKQKMQDQTCTSCIKETIEIHPLKE